MNINVGTCLAIIIPTPIPHAYSLSPKSGSATVLHEIVHAPMLPIAIKLKCTYNLVHNITSYISIGLP